MEREFVNLTPHNIVYHGTDGTLLTFEASGYVARVETVTEPNVKMQTFLGLSIQEVQIVKNTYGEITGFPEHEKIQLHQVFIVSQMILQAAYGNEKFNGITLIAPNTATGAIRNERGQVIGVNSFVTMEDLR